MEISDLKIFMAVADEGGFTAAARKVHCVQPNVTSRIKKLEEELGVQLFYRTSRTVGLTPHGKRFYRHAEKIVRLSREAVFSFQDDQPRGPLSIGITQTVASGYLPDILRSYHARYPEVEVTVRTLTDRTVPGVLLNHNLDCALVEIPFNHPDLVSLAAWDQDLVVVSAPGYSLERDDGVTALVFSSTCPYRQAMTAAFQREQITIARQLKLYNVDAILACAMGGVGISVLPRRLVDRPHIAPFVRVRPVDPADGTATICLVRHRDSIEALPARLFFEEVKRMMDAL